MVKSKIMLQALKMDALNLNDNLVRMISVIDGSPRGYDFAITVERFENTRQCPEIIPPYQRDKLSADSFPAREGSHVGISKVFSIHKPRPMLHNFPPLPPN